jgi:type I restriction enzyme, S subunit
MNDSREFRDEMSTLAAAFLSKRAGYKRTEVGVIPEDWAVVSLGAIADPKRPICYGIVQVGPFHRDGVSVIAIKNLNTDYIHNVHRSSHRVERPYARSRVRSGDVLISVKGTTGRIGIVPSHFEGNISRDVARFRLTAADLPEFWLQMLQSHNGQVALGVAVVGTTRMELSIGVLKEVQMPRPGLPEQRAIAAALSDVDALIGALDRLITKKRDLKQAATQQLLTGHTRLPGFSKPWRKSRFEELARIRNDKVFPHLVDPDTPCVELEHMGVGNGRLQSHATARNSTSAKYRFQQGDVLFGRLRSYLRKYWLADRAGICTTEIWPFAVERDVGCSGFLHAIVQGSGFLEAAALSYGTHMPRADWNVVKSLELILPPLDEQTAIAAVLSAMDAEITALEQRRAKTRLLKQGMMQELLTGRTRLV